ncbi:hypothetical protein HO173_001099 [Letharia columbiana]|uniref:PX domain-containing protein n=1 Tax=Letharia columbiana TaxID=112416 RepID=A0A8H6G4U9_9LECA|nr:uncharacterized protein HO173_001099 [Letharia columbiana]KAF6240431.1 hypothetical protein HO173_001099 [Letharia columbiana]
MDRDVFEENMRVKRIPAQPSIGKAEKVPAPRCSTDTTDTLFNLDISSNISKILLPMDAEDSPWGDVPSRSSSNTNLTKATEGVEQDSATKAKQSQASSLSATSTPRSPSARGPRTPRKVGAQATRLEAIDDSLGPLGPLGENSNLSEPELPPVPPSKEQTLPTRNTRSTPSSQPPVNKGMIDSADLVDDDRSSTTSKQRYPQQGHSAPGGIENSRRSTQPSVSIEQAARPSFDITVGDPHKIGDLTSSHIVYQVRTKTSSKAYKQPEFAVSRRYRDFLWLYNSLHNSNPGVVVPPPPEKQAVGRFDSNFVESRRSALEKMLNKTAAHPVLQHDGDLKIFLESDAFNMDVKHREHKEPGLGESKGMFSSLGLGSTTGGKFIEHDDWFHDRKIYLDALENQLKALLKSIDAVVSQRKALAEAAGDFSTSLHALSAVELSVSLSTPLEGLSDLQLRIRELYERQAQQDVLTLGITVDEYIRLIASIKTAFAQRQKSFHSWHSAEAELQKRRATQEKVLRSGKTQQDRLNQLQADVGDGERRSHQARLLFEDMGRLMRGELERFEREKVEDFKSGVETFLEGAIEAQKELIELWETFLMQLDADEDGEPFFKPPTVAPAPLRPSDEQSEGGQQHRAQQNITSESREDGEVEHGAAAIATTEQAE